MMLSRLLDVFLVRSANYSQGERAIPQLPDHIVYCILLLNEPLDDSERWKYVSTTLRASRMPFANSSKGTLRRQGCTSKLQTQTQWYSP